MRSNSLRETPEPSSNPTHFSSPGSASTIAETTATISIVDMDQWCVAANDNSVQCFLKTTLQSMIRDSARELHIEQEAEFCRVRVRTNGRLTEQKVNNPSLATELLQTMRLANSGAPYSASANDDFGELNFPIQLDGEKCDLRVCHYTTVSGKCITLSVNAASAIPEVLEQTRLDAKSINEIRRHYNSMATSDITLICSPSNDLLSSVFYALLGEVNSVERKIVSFQHRMDKTIPRVSQVLANTDLNRSAGTDNLLSLVSTAINHADHIFIDWILSGDQQIPDMLQQVACADRPVTLFWRGEAPNALVNLFSTTDRLSYKLGKIIELRDTGLICPHCAETYTLNKFDFKLLPGSVSDSESFFFATGCSRCDDTGVSTLATVTSTVAATDAMREAIRKKSLRDAEIALSDAQAKTSIPAQLEVLARTGKISFEDWKNQL